MRIWIRRAKAAAIVAMLAALWLGAGRWMEMQRMRDPLPHGASAQPARLNDSRMLQDLETLASDPFEGRYAAAPGGQKASAFVEQRFRSLALSSFNGQFSQPFNFSDRSIRGFLRGQRPFIKHYTGARNIVGYLKGERAPDRYIVVSAHFDHLGIRGGKIFHGADDNASGTAALLAVAEYLTDHPPAHSVIFAAFDGEELDLLGSEEFIKTPPVPLEKMLVNLNLDMISRGDRLFVVGTYQNPALLPAAQQAAKTSDIAVHLGHDKSKYLTGLIENWTTESDHWPFASHGIPFLYFGVEDNPDYHEPTDTIEKINKRLFSGAAEFVLSTLLLIDTGP